MPAARACLAVAVLATGWLGPVGLTGAHAQTVVSSGGSGGGPEGGAGGNLLSDGTTTPAVAGGGNSGGGGGAPGSQPGAASSGPTGGTGGYGGSNGTDFTPFDGTENLQGFGGDGGNPVTGVGGNYPYAGGGGGGAGGYGAILSGTGSFATQANIRGGDGGTGGGAFIGYGYGVGYGGGGGGGGAGILITGNAILTNNSGSVIGGYGGLGGAGSNGGAAGISGDGGAGIVIANGAAYPSNIFTNVGSGTMTGGNGGDAPSVFESGLGGQAGNGGAGLIILGGGQFINSGTVLGGAGGTVFGDGFAGSGGRGVVAIGTAGLPMTIQNNSSGRILGGDGGSAYGFASTPGNGGTGIMASTATIINRGYISGGAAGSGGYGGEVGAGGVGIVGSNLTVRTGGTITGGQGTNGTPAHAIDFTGGANTLILEPGFAFGGEVVVGTSRFRQLAVGPNVVANATGTLALGSNDTSASNTFQVDTIGSLFQGFSSFQKIESGRWRLIHTNTDALSWQVLDGTLVVDAIMPNSTFTVGDVPIDPVIGGGGTIGTLIVGNNGVVAPGIATKFTTLTVIGNATFNPGSSYQVQIGPAGQTDRIAVGGTVTVNPSNTSVNVTANPGFSSTQQFVILTVAGGLTPGSRFGSVNTTNLAFLQPVLTYTPNSIILGFASNGATFPSVAGTPNQKAAAGGIQGLGPGNPLYQVVLTQTAGGAQKAFDATSGEPHASVTTAGVGSATFISTAVFDRLWNMGGGGEGDAFQMLQNFGSTLPTLLRCYTANDATSTTNLSSYSVWGQAFGSFGHNGGNGNATALDNTLGGFIAGVDVPVYGYLADVWRFGVAGGYTNDSLTVPNRSSSGTYESAFGTLYGGMRAGAVDLRFGTSLGTDSTSLRRNVAFPGFLELERSNYGGTTVQGFAELGYRFAYGLNVLEPVAGFTAVHLHQDGFNEKGGIAALHGFGRDTDVETTTLGFRAEAVPFVEMPLVARLHLAWQHAYGDLSPTAVVAFRAGGAPFKVSGAPIDRDSALAEVGLDYRATSAMTIGLDYTGDVGPRDFANGVRGRLNYRF